MNKYCSEYERIFNYFDEDRDGKLSTVELQRCVGSIGGEEVLLEEVQMVVGSDENGLLDLDAFVGLMESDEGEEQKMEELRKAFGMYEMDDGSECITPKSLNRMLSQLDEHRTVDECVLMINQFDLNGDGVLSFDEFKVMMLT